MTCVGLSFVSTIAESSVPCFISGDRIAGPSCGVCGSGRQSRVCSFARTEISRRKASAIEGPQAVCSQPPLAHQHAREQQETQSYIVQIQAGHLPVCTVSGPGGTHRPSFEWQTIGVATRQMRTYRGISTCPARMADEIVFVL
jgi:hypothetical protein